MKEKIKKTLEEHPEGLQILEIAKLIGVHRHTATKYVYELIGAGIIVVREVGPAKLCYLSEGSVGKKLRRISK